MQSFEEKSEFLVAQAKTLLSDPQASQQSAMPGNAFFLDGGQILALPRDNGDSRYPYGKDGFNFWVYASGYMHANEGLFSHFLRAAEGQEPNIAFFAGLPIDGPVPYHVVPLMPIPCRKEPPQAVGECVRFTILSSNAAYFVTELPTLRFILRVFVTADQNICFSILAKNLSNTSAVPFFVSSYFNPFLRNQIFESGEDRWFKQMRVLEPAPNQGPLGSFVVQVNEDKDRLTSVSHYGVIRRGLTLGQQGDSNAKTSRLQRHEATTSRYQYVGGTRNSLHTATSLDAGTFGNPQPLCTFTQTAIAGDLIHLELGTDHTARLDTVFKHTDDPDMVRDLAKQPVISIQIDAELSQLNTSDAENHRRITARVKGDNDQLKPKVFNVFFEHLKRQVEFCSLIKGYIQLSPNSLIGIRDVFQALEALLYWRPDEAKEKMLEALNYTDETGRCYRQYSLPTSTGEIGRMDLRQFIDQGVWVVSCIATYLRVTGDIAFLDTPCSYYKIVDEQRGQVQPSKHRDSVLQHLFKIMHYLLENRDHDLTGCIRALYGDWNDALDGLGISQDPGRQFGNGVSVMATLQVYQCCHDMVEILTAIDQYRPRIDEYQDAAKEIAKGLVEHAIVSNEQGLKRILHGWGDQRSYLVCGHQDPDGQSRDGLTSNAFWVLSGMYEKDPEAIDQTILDAFKRLDAKYGYKTFDPAFAPDMPGVGRIRKLPAGTAENAAAYVHATAFAIMALFKMGQPKLAWEQLVKILPFTDIHQNLSHSPFVMPNAYGYNEEKYIDGQNMNDWQTGSSNVVFKLLIRYVFGFEPTLEGLWVQPGSWLPFNTFQFSAELPRNFGAVDITIDYENRGGQSRTFIVNGDHENPREVIPDTLMRLDKILIPNSELKNFIGQSVNIHVVQ